MEDGKFITLKRSNLPVDLKNLLLEGASNLSVPIDEAKVEKFFIYKDLLLEWNKNINLTAITDEKEIVIKHFLDSLSVFPAFDFYNKLKVIDVGTGAGFPGIPIAIASQNCHVTLLDSLNKRVSFLKEVCEALALTNVATFHGRAEDFGQNKDFREKFDVCVSRAVASLPMLCEFCLPFVQVGGYFLALKGPNMEDELKQSKNAVQQLGGAIERVELAEVPFSDMKHTIILIKKVKETPSKYPRKAGKITKDTVL